MNFINIPGINNSGPGHWQTLWETLYPGEFIRVQQNNWEHPVKDDWVLALQRTVASYEEPVVLVAHSLGCVTVAHWAAAFKTDAIAGALLVAPADSEKSARQNIKTFCPIPINRLPFPSILVASTNDPFSDLARSTLLAAGWGSKFVCLENKGHINAQSGLGAWNDGLSLLAGLTDAAHRLSPIVMG